MRTPLTLAFSFKGLECPDLELAYCQKNTTADESEVSVARLVARMGVGGMGFWTLRLGVWQDVDHSEIDTVANGGFEPILWENNVLRVQKEGC
mgnify:CR=1 FL=1